MAGIEPAYTTDVNPYSKRPGGAGRLYPAPPIERRDADMLATAAAFASLLRKMDEDFKSGRLTVEGWEARAEMWRKNGVIRYEYRPGKR